MNKRFSTLLATALVAGGVSAFANDAYNGPTFTPNGGTPTTPQNKEQVLLNVLSGANTLGNYLTIKGEALSLGAKPATIEEYKKFTWSVTVKTTASGVVASDPIYTFRNKAENQVLRVKLQTDNGKDVNGNGQSKEVAKISGDGNAEWGWRAGVGLYAQKGDSTFYFDADMKLCAVKGGVDKVEDLSLLNILSYVPMTVNDEIVLQASDFATILKDGKVYFNNGKDVKNAKNILTDNAWTSYAATTVNKFYLAVKDKETKSGNPYLLMVDTAYYDKAANEYHALVADTLTLALADMAKLKKGEYQESTYQPTDLTKYARPINAALFSGKYYPMNDSIVLTVTAEPGLTYGSAIIDGSKQYGNQVKNDVAITGANVNDLPGANKAQGGSQAMMNLYTTVSKWFEKAISTDGTTAASGYALKYAESKFNNVSGELSDAGDKSFFEAAQAWVKDEANKDDANLADYKKFVAAVEKLERVKGATAADFFVKGTPHRASTASEATIALRELNDTKVLTVAEDVEVGYIKPLVQPYKTAPDFGGTADIDVTKVYYLKDLNKYTAAGDAKNENEGLFFNLSPVAQNGYLAEGQAFNPYCQYVFVKTPGADKGSYTIYNRGTGEARRFSGLTDVLGADSIVIGTDSLMLVDANIAYTGKDAEKQIGYKFAPEYDLVNKSFMIHSASPLLKDDLYLHMKSDSSIMVAVDEVLYNLEAAVAPVQYGATVAGIDTLEYQPYYIKTAKGEYLVANEAENGYILTKDASKLYEEMSYKDGTATKKYNAVKTAFYFIATDNADTYVLVEAEPCQDATKAKALSYEVHGKKATINTQSGILESSDDDVRNDLFYVVTEPTPASLFTAPKHVQLKAINGDIVAVGKDNFGVVAREGDLKAAYEKDDFTFWLDTARYTDNEGKDLVTPSYYVTKGVAAVEETKAAADKRLYMYVAADSAKNATIEKEQYSYDSKTRIQFREAVRYGADSLVVAGDTLTLDGKATATITKPKKGVNYFRFNFLVDKDNEGYYNILNENNYVQNVNGVLVVTSNKADALKVAVKDAEAPTANEGVEVSEVTVIAGAGQVTIANAAGKKVVVSNILGQTVANTVITSDNATIAAPAGVVVVAVEGEEAVKAIVK